MNKTEMEKELGELIYRFKCLKKALEEDENLSPAQRAIQAYVDQLSKKQSPPQPKTDVMRKAREITEQRQAQNLAAQLQKAGILGVRPPPPRQPTTEEQEAWAAANGFGMTQEMAKTQESQWGNSINNWLVEATKPLNQRFKNEEEERAYWDSIKINGGSGNEGSGY